MALLSNNYDRNIIGARLFNLPENDNIVCTNNC